MKKTILKISLAFLFIVSGMVHLSAQEVGEEGTIETYEGNSLYGTIKVLNDSIISIETKELGLVTLSRSKVKKINSATKQADGTYWFENPNATRNLFGPTAFGLRKGEAYYQNTWLFLHTVSYGITDNFTIGGGLEIASLIFDSGQTPAFVLTPKFQTAYEKGFNASAGVFFIHANNWLSDQDDLNAAIFYGAGTVGNRDNNFTIGTGFGRAEGEWADGPVITISGMLRVSKHFGLVSENWIVNDLGALLSFGGRYIARSVTVDLAIVFSSEEDDVRLPWLGVTIPFGSKKK